MENASRIQKVVLIIAAIIGSYLILSWGKQIFLPLAFSLLFTFLLHPICSYFERYMSSTLSIITIFVLITGVIGGISYFFIDQFISIFEGLQLIVDDINNIFDTGLQWFSDQMNMTEEESKEFLKSKASEAASTPLSFISQGIVESTMVFMNFVFVAIYTFFFLLYRVAFKNFIVSRFSEKNQDEVELVIKKIQRMVFKYLGGIFFVILIVATLNAVGLSIIGVKNAIFWGVFSGCLVIIPYIGTFIGAILPILHALITGEFWWQPIAVAGLFVVVQFVEGNFITPNVVGSSVKVNPLAAMISVILGGVVWGIGGAVIAIPFLALIKILFDHVDGYEAYGQLLDSNIFKKKRVFYKK